jgi:hypothetical protein
VILIGLGALAEKAKPDAKTAGLRRGRLDKGGEDLPAHAPRKPRGKVLKARAK